MNWFLSRQRPIVVEIDVDVQRVITDELVLSRQRPIVVELDVDIQRVITDELVLSLQTTAS